MSQKEFENSFLLINTDKDLQKYIWEIWHISKGAVSYSKNIISDRLNYTLKFVIEKYPKLNKMALYKYITREI